MSIRNRMRSGTFRAGKHESLLAISAVEETIALPLKSDLGWGQHCPCSFPLVFDQQNFSAFLIFRLLKLAFPAVWAHHLAVSI